jgi:hypothetical protein
MHADSERQDAADRLTLAVFCLLTALPVASYLLAPASVHASENELRVIPLKHRMADEIVPVLRPLLAPGESVSGMDSRLIVRASRATFAQIERVLNEVDVARRNLRISIRHNGERDDLRQQRSIAGEAHAGQTRIFVNGGSGNGPGGLVIRRSGPNGTVEVRNERHLSTARDASTQILTVLEGSQALLRVGESVPQVQPFLALAGNRLMIVTGIQYYDVATGFEVETRIIGNRVQLTVTPRLAFLGSQGTQTVNFQELRTTVTIAPREWVDLGGMVESANEVNRQILNTERAQHSTRYMIRVDPL